MSVEPQSWPGTPIRFEEFVDRQASARVRLGEVPGHRNDHQLRVVELRDVSMEPLVFVGVVTGVRDRRQRPAVEDEHVEDCSGRVDVVADLDRSYHRAIQAHRLDRDEGVRRHRVEPDPIRRRRSPGAVGEPHYVGAERGRAEPGGRAVGGGDLGGRRRALGRLERGRRRDDLPAELRGSGAHPLRLAVEPDVAADDDAPVPPRPDQRALAADEEADGRLPRRLAAATHPNREDVLATPKPIADRGRQGPHPVPGEAEVVADLDAVEAGVEHSRQRSGADPDAGLMGADDLSRLRRDHDLLRGAALGRWSGVRTDGFRAGENAEEGDHEEG